MTTIKDIHKRYTNSSEMDLAISKATKKDLSFIYTHPEDRLTFIQWLKFLNYNRKINQGFPWAYIDGKKEFYGLDFFVNKHTLIPRPDTELLVEEAIQALKQTDNSIIIDIGTGSGCIPIAIAKTLGLTNNIYAIDISKGALKVAKKNASKHDAQIFFLRGSLLKPLTKLWPDLLQHCIIITANLPYLTDEQFNQEKSIQHEPKSALVAKNQGLAIYEELLNQIQTLVTQFPKLRLQLLLEIDPTQNNRLSEIIKNTFPKVDIKIKTDLAGQDRLLIVSIG